MKLFVGEVPVNPFKRLHMSLSEEISYEAYTKGQNSILDQCIEMDDIEKLAVYLLHCKEIKQGTEK